jgi:hypothetical protein
VLDTAGALSSQAGSLRSSVDEFLRDVRAG